MYEAKLTYSQWEIVHPSIGEAIRHTHKTILDNEDLSLELLDMYRKSINNTIITIHPLNRN